MPSVVILSVFMLSVFILCVVMLSVAIVQCLNFYSYLSNIIPDYYFYFYAECCYAGCRGAYFEAELKRFSWTIKLTYAGSVRILKL